MRYAFLSFVLCLLACTNVSYAAELTLLRGADRPDTLVVSHPAAYVQIDAKVYAMNLGKELGRFVAVNLHLPGIGDVTLDVQRFSVFSEDAQLLAVTKQGVERIQKPQSILLRGSVRNMPGSHVMLACHPNYALGYIDVSVQGNHRRFLVSPTADPNAPVTLIVYDERYSIAPAPWNCHVKDETVPIDIEGRGGKQHESTQAGTLRRVDMAIEGDFDYYLDHGSNAIRATEYAEDVVAACSDIYQRDVDGLLNISQWTLFTVNDPYPGTASNTLLVQFRDYWRVNKAGVVRSIAHLFSGVNGIGGIAYLDVLCNKNNGYAVDGLNNNVVYPRTAYAWDTDVVSHELGHNVGSPHTHACSWAPPIDSCFTAEGTCFTGTKAVRGTIMSYCHLNAFGTQLAFHARVQTLIKARLAAASACVALVTDLSVSAGADVTICPGAEVMLRATVNGGTAPFTYTWTPTTALVNGNTSTPLVNPMTTTHYVCEVRDASSAIRRDTVIVRVNSQLALTHVSELTICEGESVALRPLRTSCGIGTITHTWTPTTGLSSSITLFTVASPVVTTTYQCMAIHQCGDTARVSILVRVNERPRVTLPSDQVICKGSTVNVPALILRGKAGYTLDWTFNGKPDAALSSNIIDLVPDSTTTVVLKATDANGCVGTDTMLIVVNPTPKVSLSRSAKTCPADPVMVLATATAGSPPYAYRWRLGGELLSETVNSVMIAPARSSKVSCVVIDANGCTDSADAMVEVRSLDMALLPSRLSVPSLEACQNEMQPTVELRNTDKDTIRIVSISASSVIPATTLPIVLAPGAYANVVLRIRLPFVGEVRDTIRLLDAACNRVYELPITGSRGGIQATTALGINLGASVECETPSELHATAAIRNSSTSAVTLTQFTPSQTLPIVISAALPVQIAAGATLDLPIVVRGVLPAGNISDSIIAVFKTALCNGVSPIPIRFAIAPYGLGIPESIDFGSAASSQQVSRSITITPNFEGLSQVVVTKVGISNPFTTDLEVGTALHSGRPLIVNVRFSSSDVVTQGAQKGTLRIGVDGCENSAAVELLASTVVGVQGEDGGQNIRVHYDVQRNGVVVRGEGVRSVRIIDVLGRTLHATAASTEDAIHIGTQGLVFVVVTTDAEEHAIPIIVR